MRNKKLFVFILLGAALIGVALWRFGGEEPSTSPPTASPPAGETQKSVEKFVIEGDEFSFSPQNITVTRGATVELTFKNIGRVPHNYIVDELGLATKTISAGRTDVVTFVAPNTPSAISFSSYCSVPGHREAGMEGTIEIK